VWLCGGGGLRGQIDGLDRIGVRFRDDFWKSGFVSRGQEVFPRAVPWSWRCAALVAGGGLAALLQI